MRMKVCILLLFVSSCLARTSPERGRKMPFQSPTEIKTIVLACDQDKDGELNSKELEECVSSMIYIIFFFPVLAKLFQSICFSKKLQPSKRLVIGKLAN